MHTEPSVETGGSMDIILVILAIVFFVANRNAKKKREEEQKRRAQQAAQMQGAAPPQPDPRAQAYAPAERQREDPRFPSYGPAQQREDPRFPSYGAAQQREDPRFPGHAPAQQRPGMAAAAQQGQARPVAAQHQAKQQPMRTDPIRERVSQSVTQKVSAQVDSRLKETTRQHDLEASFLTGHAHTESSMEAEQACPPARRGERTAAPGAAPQPRYAAPQPLYAALESLGTDTNALMQGIVIAEILGKPKALRR